MTDWLPGTEPISGADKPQPGFVYAQDTCGCIHFSCIDTPSEVRSSKNYIARHVMRGETIKHAAFGHLPPWYCDEHRPEGWED